ncbi:MULTISPECIES: oligopeptide ABC transporter permease OppB [Marinobacter]|jgi:oligopeptide transport system permease protein|uniref:Oligopeptide transport system permease protein n=1 Tax=Marinobacter salarius TaxID=1420917 RepID=A0ABY1FTT8_9GAMM|nr:MULTISPECIES: oligopeptide ABC transporter permease OppB [Marinobacter]AZR40160.1 dipeptide transport system permease protein DppB [Marinobacter salarius]KXJ46103.1 MAG: oligopeptide transporter permease [Marinobacter sp. Hex_13]MAB50344.1 oligopeptide ABC transporter permease OppB [Marinobacter sp.]MBJ7277141.1 oligopeptide ABC transporter permease OppB [Marinobacter salarius]MBJ7300479.1 oligopeptide ABC transporter permease OppB [Marinobacter salarius]|tara:strand:+ start:496 stop:1416 length:921 start_codon:yes stop_codon:yes gene_type:complete
MFSFIIRRLAVAVPTILALITVSFVLMHAAPGGPFTNERNVPEAVMENIEAKYNLDKPLWQQYLIYVGNVAQGDLGPSFRYKDFTVNELIESSFPRSAYIGAWSFLFVVVFGVGLGVVAALKQNRWPDYTVMTAAMTGVVFPNFVMAPLLVLLFAVTLRWLPAGGWEGGQVEYIVLPIIAMATSYIAQVARITRSSMIETLRSPFIRTARAKGIPRHKIVLRHALKPALIPVVSYLGPAFVGIITGSVIIDQVFSTGGIGQHFVNGAINRDYSLILGVTILVGVLTIVFNAAVDILYTWLDPRVRY